MELENLINYYLSCIDNLTFIEDNDKLIVKLDYVDKPKHGNDWLDRYNKFIAICETNGGILDIELNKTFKKSLGLNAKVYLSNSHIKKLKYNYPNIILQYDKNDCYITMEILKYADIDDELRKSLYNSIFDICNDDNDEIDIFDKAYDIVNDKYPGIFKKGKINGDYMTLLRIKSDKCPLSNKIHDNDNSYLYIKETSISYQINFGCNRGCTIGRNCKTKKIGTIKK